MNNFLKYISLFSFTFFSFIYAGVIKDQILPERFKIFIYVENIKSASHITESKDEIIFVGSKSDGSLSISDDNANVVYRVTYSPNLI